LYKKIRIPCIHCKKPVGTQFIEKNRKLQAKCGATKYDKHQPCELNIVIQKGNFETIPGALRLYDEGKEPDKNELIKTKLNLFFQFSDETNTLSVFDKIKKDYSDTNAEYTKYLTDLTEETPYLKNKKMIKTHSEKMTQKKQEIINLIKESKTENDQQFTKDAVELYINDLLPMIEKDRALKYSYYHLEEDFYDDKIKNLVVNEFSISSMEFIIDTDPDIIHYNK